VRPGPMQSLWNEVATAHWVAEVGLPLLATLIALGLSVLFLRRQLRHDRELATAERRVAAASALGQALVAEVDRFESEKGDSPFWRQKEWPDFGAVLQARGSAALVLGDEPALEDVVSVARTPLWIWRTCQSEWGSLHAGGLSLTMFSLALDSVLYEWKETMHRYGAALIRWDGLGQAPRLAVGDKEHVPLSVMDHRAAHESWIQKVRSEFRSTALRIQDLRQAP
jgi:hypothetical protein